MQLGDAITYSACVRLLLRKEGVNSFTKLPVPSDCKSHVNHTCGGRPLPSDEDGRPSLGLTVSSETGSRSGQHSAQV